MSNRLIDIIDTEGTENTLGKMKTIDLQKAYDMIANSEAVIVDRDAVVYPRFDNIKGDPSNEILFLYWEADGLEYSITVMEDGNENVKVDGTDLIFVDSDNHEVRITPLYSKEIEP